MTVSRCDVVCLLCLVLVCIECDVVCSFNPSEGGILGHASKMSLLLRGPYSFLPRFRFLDNRCVVPCRSGLCMFVNSDGQLKFFPTCNCGGSVCPRTPSSSVELALVSTVPGFAGRFFVLFSLSVSTA